MSTDRPTPGPLARRVFRQVGLLSVTVVLCAGAVEATFGHLQAREQVLRLQAVQAQAASSEIEQYLLSIERAFRPIQALPWGQQGFGPDARRDELHRLMAVVPAIVDLTDVADDGWVLRAVSRARVDRLDAGPAEGGTGPREGYAQPSFSDQGSPQVQLTLARAGNPPGQTEATINLQFLADVVSGLRLPDGGKVFVVDAQDRLLVHPDASLPLRHPDIRQHPMLVPTRQAPLGEGPAIMVHEGPGLEGGPSIATAVRLKSTGWLVFVEHPSDVALAPAFATLWRTVSLVLLAAVAAMFASAAFARRMAAPIARLRAATAGMAAGQLEQRLDLSTGDEIQGLAEDFNVLSTRLQQSYGELEDKVQRRTAELVLRRDEAERANAAKTRFLASASHDLRQPMHAIGLLVGVLRERLTEPGQRVLADKTHQAVQAMEGLFGSLLDVSKLDAGAVRPQPCTFALQDLLDRVQLSYAPLAAAKSLRLRMRRTALRVHTDPALFERLLGNLVSNAIRYTRHGGVLVGCRPRGGGWVVQVVDSGVGIEAGQLDLIFEEFVRLDPAAAGGQGLGLGLSIVRRTAVLLGLTVDVRSRPGHGSVFELSLPPVQALPQPEAGTPLPATLQHPLTGAFVLVVDDDARNLEATTVLLQQWGCLVAAAEDAGSAMVELQRHLRPPDVLLTDLRLGTGPNGIDLIRSLRAQCGVWLPAVLVTADTRLPQALDGDTQCLQKPVGAQRLQQALAQALAGSERNGS